MDLRQWLPPLPPEHGAKTILVIALATPISVRYSTELPFSIRTAQGYGLFVGFAIGVLLLREAVKRTIRADGSEKRRYAILGAIETVGSIGFVIGLALLVQIWWLLLAIVLPPVVWFARQEQQTESSPLIQAGFGVVSLGTLVPLGMILIGFTEPVRILTITGLFIGYHSMAVIRVGGLMEPQRVPDRLVLGSAIALVSITIAGYFLLLFGIGAVVVFFVSGFRSLILNQARQQPSLKRLGQWEAALSLVFVISGPFLLP